MNLFPNRIVDSVNGLIGKVKLLLLKTVSFNPTTPSIMEFKDQDGGILDTIQLGIDNVDQLSTKLGNKLEETDVTNLNTNLSKHNILQIGSTIIGETITELKPLELVGNIFTLKMQGENGVVQEVAIDLSSLKTTESGVTNATYNAATNIILLTEADGTEHSIDLSEFSIIRTVDVNGVVTLTQEGVVKATISKVGESGEYSHILNLPDLTIYETKVDATTHKTNTTNPHGVTASQVGLGNVNNTSDTNKPVSTAQQAEINAAEQRAKDAIDSEIDVIKIKKSNLPANFTIGDVLNYLNTLTITKAKDEEIFWETGDFFDTLTIVYPTEGTVVYDSSTVTMQITIT